MFLATYSIRTSPSSAAHVFASSSMPLGLMLWQQVLAHGVRLRLPPRALWIVRVHPKWETSLRCVLPVCSALLLRVMRRCRFRYRHVTPVEKSNVKGQVELIFPPPLCLSTHPSRPPPATPSSLSLRLQSTTAMIVTISPFRGVTELSAAMLHEFIGNEEPTQIRSQVNAYICVPFPQLVH